MKRGWLALLGTNRCLLESSGNTVTPVCPPAIVKKKLLETVPVSTRTLSAVQEPGTAHSNVSKSQQHRPQVRNSAKGTVEQIRVYGAAADEELSSKGRETISFALCWCFVVIFFWGLMDQIPALSSDTIWSLEGRIFSQLGKVQVHS